MHLLFAVAGLAIAVLFAGPFHAGASDPITGSNTLAPGLAMFGIVWVAILGAFSVITLGTQLLWSRMEKVKAVAAFAFLFAVVWASSASAQTETVNVGSIFGAWRPYLTELVSIAIAAFLGWVLNLIRQRTGLDIEARHREALQTALTNAAGLVISRVDGAAAAVKIPVGSPVIREGVEYVLKGAPDALKYFGITPDSLRDKVFAKVGVVASSAVTPNAGA